MRISTNFSNIQALYSQNSRPARQPQSSSTKSEIENIEKDAEKVRQNRRTTQRQMYDSVEISDKANSMFKTLSKVLGET